MFGFREFRLVTAGVGRTLRIPQLVENAKSAQRKCKFSPDILSSKTKLSKVSVKEITSHWTFKKQRFSFSLDVLLKMKCAAKIQNVRRRLSGEAQKHFAYSELVLVWRVGRESIASEKEPKDLVWG